MARLLLPILLVVPATGQAFQVRLHLPNARIAINAPLTVELGADRACSVRLILRNRSGNCQLMLPNPRDTSDSLQPGVIRQLPGVRDPYVIAESEAGDYELLLLASTCPFPEEPDAGELGSLPDLASLTARFWPEGPPFGQFAIVSSVLTIDPELPTPRSSLLLPVESGVRLDSDDAPRFTSEGSRLSLAAKAELRRWATAMNSPAYRHQCFIIEGHSDASGTLGYNMRLSESRADAAVAYLAQCGVLPERLTAMGRGHFEPCADNSTLAGRRRNRRITLMIDPSVSGARPLSLVK